MAFSLARIKHFISDVEIVEETLKFMVPILPISITVADTLRALNYPKVLVICTYFTYYYIILRHFWVLFCSCVLHYWPFRHHYKKIKSRVNRSIVSRKCLHLALIEEENISYFEQNFLK